MKLLVRSLIPIALAMLLAVGLASPAQAAAHAPAQAVGVPYHAAATSPTTAASRFTEQDLEALLQQLRGLLRELRREQGRPAHWHFETVPGGIMTDEVGAITGPVEAWIRGDRVKIRYESARDLYTVSGRVGDRSPDEVLKLLTTDPGVDEFNNPRTVDLT